MDKSSKNQELAELCRKYVAQGHTCAHQVYFESGKGAILKDVTGREYIDFSGGIGGLQMKQRRS
jgi:4-aminobutyrate aminotransferase/(S)-3-amino-2-methylpropionate transaminase